MKKGTITIVILVLKGFVLIIYFHNYIIKCETRKSLPRYIVLFMSETVNASRCIGYK